jgi:tape measure domain-containing protein
MGFTVDIRGNASHLQKTINKAESSLKNLGSKVVTASGAGIAAMGAAGAAGLGIFIVKSSEAAASLEDLAMQFEVLTGSTEKSKELLAAFREEEKKSALDTSDYANAAKTILAFGGAYETVIPTLKMLGDISMGNAERFSSLATAFAQTTAAGRLMGQEVLQFVNAGFNPLAQIAKDTGRSMADLKKEMEAGKISVDMVRQAFVNATSKGGLFFNAINKGSATTSAKINQTKAAVTQLQVAFGTGMNEGLRSALDATSNFLPQLQERFAQAGNTLGVAIKDAVEGNMELFGALGGMVGEAMWLGLKAIVINGLDSLAPILGEQVAKNISTAFMPLAIMPKEIQDMIGNPIRNATQSQTNLASEMGRQLSDLPRGSSATRVNQIMEAKNLQQAIQQGIKTGLMPDMPDAVRKGVAAALYGTRTLEAKFSN